MLAGSNLQGLFVCLIFLEIGPLQPQDAVLDYGPLGNFSLAGFEMVLTRYVSTYLITYYLPSGRLFYLMRRQTTCATSKGYKVENMFYGKVT